MAEIKTEPVKAQLIADKDAFNEGLVPGSFRVGPADSYGEQNFWYCCPCGCKTIGPLTVGNGFKPDDAPSWHWNGSLEAPALHPSVHHTGHWHGWLKGGIWKSV